MVIKLQPMQISSLWDAIKLAAIRANSITSEQEQHFANKVLEALLTEVYQCWVLCYDNEEGRQISAIGITSIVNDKLFNLRYLNMHTVFGFRVMTPELKREAFEAFSAFAAGNGCAVFRTSTNNKAIKGLAEESYMTEILTTYSYKL
jgi:hypothetical protein